MTREGTAGFLISAYKRIIDENRDADGKVILTPDEKSKLTNSLVGYDISQDMVRLSRVNMYLHNFPDPKIYEYDTLTSQDRWDDQFDVILANPPFMTPKGGITPHNRFSVQAKRSEVLFVDYIAEHLNPNGRAGIIVPEGIVFQTANAYKDLRKMLVDNEYLYAVISLPAGVFNPYSSVKTSVLLFDKALAKKTDKILFVKIDNDGFDLGAQRRELLDSDIPKAVELIKSFMAYLSVGKDFEIPEYDKEFAVLAEKETIKSNEYILVGERYKTVKTHNHKGWELVKIEDVCLINGSQIDPINVFGNDSFIYLDISSVENKTGYIDYSNYILGTDAPSRARRKVSNGDVLLSTVRPNLQAFGYVDYIDVRKCVASTGFAVLSPVKILGKYLHKLLFDERVMNQMINSMGKGAYPSINQRDVANIKIPLPPMAIQEKIVSEIESYQKIIDGARQIVENYKPNFKINPEWEMVELGKVTKIISGYAFGSRDFNETNGTKVIKITNIGVREFVEDENYLPVSYSESYCRYLANENDVAIALTRPYISSGLKVCIVPHKYNNSLVNQRTAVIRQIDNISNHLFIYYTLLSNYVLEYIVEKSKSLNQPNLSVKDLEKLQIPLPKIEEQNEIVEKINEEVIMVQQNKRLIEIFEQKISDKIAEVWGE